MSKKLDSILKSVPFATAQNEKSMQIEKYSSNNAFDQVVADNDHKFDRIVAVIPRNLKKQIKLFLANNPDETEKTVILKGLRKMGFDIQNEWLIDKRGRR